MGAATFGACGETAGFGAAAGRGAAPIDGLPTVRGEGVATFGFGACAGVATALAGLGVAPATPAFAAPIPPIIVALPGLGVGPAIEALAGLGVGPATVALAGLGVGPPMRVALPGLGVGDATAAFAAGVWALVAMPGCAGPRETPALALVVGETAGGAFGAAPAAGGAFGAAPAAG